MSVDVIMPNLNQGQYIAKAIASVLDDPAVSSIIVYDDGSTDNSLDVVRSVRSEKVKLIGSQSSVGATRARAAAIASSRSVYLFFLDSDDFLDPLTVSACVASASSHGYDLCLPPAFLTDKEGNGREPFLHLQGVVSGADAALLTLGGWKIFTQGVLRRSVYEDAIKSFKPYGYSDDELLSRHIFLACRTVGEGFGGYNYRVIAKQATPVRNLQFALTSARALVLVAERLPDRTTAVAAHFTNISRSLVNCWAQSDGAYAADCQSLGNDLYSLARQLKLGTAADRLSLRLMAGPRSAVTREAIKRLLRYRRSFTT